MGIFKKKEEIPRLTVFVKLIRQESKKITSEILNIGNYGAGTFSDGLEQIIVTANPHAFMHGIVITADDFRDMYERKMKRNNLEELQKFYEKISEEMQEIHERINKEMQGLTHEWAMESLQIEKLLPLLNIANNDTLGAEKAISYAYRYGYLEGKKDLSDKIMNGFTDGNGGETDE
ncbi:MAG: hypothetical protein NC548_59285 [Lachnospiraceae bacterium]|nr:hypothetical protein [Lachnospiraceae bacterium]